MSQGNRKTYAKLYDEFSALHAENEVYKHKVQQLQQQNQEMLEMLKKVLFRAHIQQEDEWLEEEALSFIAKMES